MKNNQQNNKASEIFEGENSSLRKTFDEAVNKDNEVREEWNLEEEINKELGHISGIFMSQGDTRAGDIIMPTEELLEAKDRLLLYFSKALHQREQQIKSELLEKIEERKLPDSFGHYGENDQLHIQHNIGYNQALSDIISKLSEVEQ